MTASGCEQPNAPAAFKPGGDGSYGLKPHTYVFTAADGRIELRPAISTWLLS